MSEPAPAIDGAPTSAGRLERALVAVYPRAWRERYSQELVDLLTQLREEGAGRWRLRVDVARSGCAERLRGAELLGDGPAGSRARGGSLLVLWAWVLFVLAGCAVAKFAEHWQDAVPGDDRSVPATAYGLLTVLAILAAVAVAAGLAAALPELAGALRTGLWPRLRRPVAVAMALSAAQLVATTGLIGWAAQLTQSQRDGHNSAYAMAILGWVVLGAACLVAWAVVATVAVRRIELSGRARRLHSVLGIGVAAAMVAMTAATLGWWIALARTAPWVLHGLPAGASASPFAPALARAAAGMVLASALATVGARRCARAVPGLARDR
jgi:hypothetical protein